MKAPAEIELGRQLRTARFQHSIDHVRKMNSLSLDVVFDRIDKSAAACGEALGFSYETFRSWFYGRRHFSRPGSVRQLLQTISEVSKHFPECEPVFYGAFWSAADLEGELLKSSVTRREPGFAYKPLWSGRDYKRLHACMVLLPSSISSLLITSTGSCVERVERDVFTEIGFASELPVFDQLSVSALLAIEAIWQQRRGRAQWALEHATMQATSLSALNCNDCWCQRVSLFISEIESQCVVAFGKKSTTLVTTSCALETGNVRIENIPSYGFPPKYIDGYGLIFEPLCGSLIFGPILCI